MNENAAHNLEGLILKSGWTVIEKLESTPGSTGAFFSVCYKAEKDGEVCFLKALDFNKFFITARFENPNEQAVDVIAKMVAAFRYERDLSNHCKGKHVTKVSFVREADQEILEGFTYPLVPYLIFEMADGDVRSHIKFANKLDFTWKLGSLHDIAVGLKQLHKIEVSHQDIKPSNILLFNKESKIGDIGRALCKNLESPLDGSVFTGDGNYAPPEIMYGYFEADWHKRAYAIDCYLLGSLVVFYYAGISMSALLMKNIDQSFRADVWRGDFDTIKPYILDAFSKSLTEFSGCFKSEYYKKELVQIVEQLCYPIPDKRGHPKTIALNGNSFDLERFVSRFDNLFRRAEYELKHQQLDG